MRLMRWKLPLTVCLAGLALGVPVLAADMTAMSAASNLREATELAWKLNPQISALDSRDAEARAAQELAANLTPEPGAISFSNRDDRLNRNHGQKELEVELTTPLWLPGQKTAREREAATRINEAITKRSALRWEIAGEVRESWWNLASARNANTLALRRLETARALDVDVSRRYKVGDLSRIDANLAQTEVHIAETELIESEATLTQSEQSFFLLTGAAAPATLGEEQLVAHMNARELVDAPLLHPLVAKAVSALSSARARAKVAEQTQRASPELALRMVRERSAEDQPYANSVGIRLKIPFSSGAQVRQVNAAIQAETIQAESEMVQIKTRVQQMLEQLQRLQMSVERQVAIAQQSRSLSDENLTLAEKAFKLGESDLAALLRIRAAAFNAESFLDRQRIARASLISRLNQALGVLP